MTIIEDQFLDVCSIEVIATIRTIHIFLAYTRLCVLVGRVPNIYS